MSRLVDRITPGEWLRDGRLLYVLMHYGWRKGVSQYKNRAALALTLDKDCPRSEADANLDLITEAFNVAHQSGRSPSELLAERDDLAALLKRARDPLSLYAAYGWADRNGVIRDITAALAKLEKTS